MQVKKFAEEFQKEDVETFLKKYLLSRTQEIPPKQWGRVFVNGNRNFLEDPAYRTSIGKTPVLLGIGSDGFIGASHIAIYGLSFGKFVVGGDEVKKIYHHLETAVTNEVGKEEWLKEREKRLKNSRTLRDYMPDTD